MYDSRDTAVFTHPISCFYRSHQLFLPIPSAVLTDPISCFDRSHPVIGKNSCISRIKQHGMESENTCNFSIFDTFGRYIWKAIAPRSKHSGTPNLELEVRRVCTVLSTKSPPTSGNLYVRRKRVRLYLSSEFTLLTLV